MPEYSITYAYGDVQRLFRWGDILVLMMNGAVMGNHGVYIDLGQIEHAEEFCAFLESACGKRVGETIRWQK